MSKNEATSSNIVPTNPIEIHEQTKNVPLVEPSNAQNPLTEARKQSPITKEAKNIDHSHRKSETIHAPVPVPAEEAINATPQTPETVNIEAHLAAALNDKILNGEGSRAHEENLLVEHEEEGTEEEEDEEEETEEIVTTPPRPLIPIRPGICAKYRLPTCNIDLDVFLMIRRKKTTIFIDAKEDTSVLELKRMIAGITKVLPEDQKLFKDSVELDEKKNISDYHLNAATAKPQLPATIALIFKDENGEWENIDMAPLSNPPELPEVMRQQETHGHAEPA